MKAYRCACGTLLRYEGESHRCSAQREVEISATEYCAKFGHSDVVQNEVPGSSRVIGRSEQVWESETKYCTYRCYRAIVRCRICGRSAEQYFEKSIE